MRLPQRHFRIRPSAYFLSSAWRTITAGAFGRLIWVKRHSGPSGMLLLSNARMRDLSGADTDDWYVVRIHAAQGDGAARRAERGAADPRLQRVRLAGARRARNRGKRAPVACGQAYSTSRRRGVRGPLRERRPGCDRFGGRRAACAGARRGTGAYACSAAVFAREAIPSAIGGRTLSAASHSRIPSPLGAHPALRF